MRIGQAGPDTDAGIGRSPTECNLPPSEVYYLTGEGLTGECDPVTGYQFRYPYDVRQFFAPLNEQELPAAKDFRFVRCHDLSRAGVSFITQRPITLPGVISLGRAPQLSFLFVKPLKSKVVFMHGHAGFWNDCQFVRRLDKGEYIWHAAAGKIIRRRLQVAAPGV